jgi:cytochrome c peroxidase
MRTRWILWLTLCLPAALSVGCSDDNGPKSNPSLGDAGADAAAADAPVDGAPAPTADASVEAGSASLLGADEMAKLRTLSPLPALPPDPTNAYADNPKAAALGQRFFFDSGASGPLGDIGARGGLGNVGETGKVSCQSCHVAKDWFIDTRSMPNKISSGATSLQSHNTTSLVNAAFYTWFNWNGGRDTLWIAGTAVGSMNGSPLSVAHRIFDAYRTEYDAVFTPKLDPALDAHAPDAARFPRPTAIVPAGRPPGTPPVMQGSPGDPTWMMMTPGDQQVVLTIVANFAKAMGAYERLLVSRDSPFDKFVAGDATAISDVAKRGAALFVGKARCISCHVGPLLSDNQFHNLGEGPSTDEGRFGAIPGLARNQFNSGGMFSDDPDAGKAKLSGLMQDASQVGAFRTPTLRNIAQTAPYMHTGRLATLEEVIDFYDAGGGTITPPPAPDGGAADAGVPPAIKDPLVSPIGLTADEKAALLAFLQTLTGSPIPAPLTADTSVPPPPSSPPPDGSAPDAASADAGVGN